MRKKALIIVAMIMILLLLISIEARNSVQHPPEVEKKERTVIEVHSAEAILNLNSSEIIDVSCQHGAGVASSSEDHIRVGLYSFNEGDRPFCAIETSDMVYILYFDPKPNISISTEYLDDSLHISILNGERYRVAGTLSVSVDNTTLEYQITIEPGESKRINVPASNITVAIIKFLGRETTLYVQKVVEKVETSTPSNNTGETNETIELSIEQVTRAVREENPYVIVSIRSPAERECPVLVNGIRVGNITVPNGSTNVRIPMDAIVDSNYGEKNVTLSICGVSRDITITYYPAIKVSFDVPDTVVAENYARVRMNITNDNKYEHVVRIFIYRNGSDEVLMDDLFLLPAKTSGERVYTFPAEQSGRYFIAVVVDDLRMCVKTIYVYAIKSEGEEQVITPKPATGNVNLTTSIDNYKLNINVTCDCNDLHVTGTITLIVYDDMLNITDVRTITVDKEGTPPVEMTFSLPYGTRFVIIDLTANGEEIRKIIVVPY